MAARVLSLSLPLSNLAGWIVELESGVWLTNGTTLDHTLFMGNAAIYATEAAARGERTRARKHRPFLEARIVQVGLVEVI